MAFKILLVATKPVDPPTDGGKLLIWKTLQELSRRGHEVTLVAPDLGLHAATSTTNSHLDGCRMRLVPSRAAALAPSFGRALITGRPLSLVRHSHTAVRDAIRDELEAHHYDLVHAEQVQSLCNIPMLDALPPVVFRAQNVESHLWQMVAKIRPRVAWLARSEARKMARLEAASVSQAAATIVLTQRDAQAFIRHSPEGRESLSRIPPPFDARLPASDEAIEGDPPILLLGGGWLPNRDSIAWFFSSLWDDVVRANPDAMAHVFGDRSDHRRPRVAWHRSPSSSRHLFRPGVILAVPLRVASGIRMKIIEAWSRGTPVVATPEAAEGLEATHGTELLLARNGREFGAAIARIRTEPGLRQHLVASGRARLEQHHDPIRIGALLEAAYEGAIARHGSG